MSSCSRAGIAAALISLAWTAEASGQSPATDWPGVYAPLSSENSQSPPTFPAPQGWPSINAAAPAQWIAGPPVEQGGQLVAGPPAAAVSYDWAAQMVQPAGSPLEQQLAQLNGRVAALEKPPPKYPSVTVSGVFQADGVVFSQDDANRLPPAAGGVGYIENGADIRRARLGARAAVTNNMNAFMQFDFGFQGRPTFTDVWVEWTDLPVLGTVRVGQWKQPFSLEVVSSFRYTTFMERSSLFQAFTPFRHLGVGAYNHTDDLMTTWAASFIRTGQDQFGNSLSTAGGNGFVGRATHLMWYDEAEGRDYLHVGGGYYLNSPPKHTTSFRTIPEIFVGQNANDGVGTTGFAVPGVFDGTPFFVNTGTLTQVEHVHTFGVEALWVYGPWSVQAEGMAALVDRPDRDTAALDGGYVQVGYFLTGEHRPYDRVAGAIDRVKPFEDFFWVQTDNGLERGLGAWEVAFRFSHIDLNDADVSGGVMDNFTFGVNWYCNANCKVVFNYIHSWLDSPTSPPRSRAAAPPAVVQSEANAFGLRAQVDF